ncbi:relaxin receptor 1 [Phlebotomus papatasi]|uniref:relaxin receptor 1 n=1 Tax=Phlebotomus papatasi TaxID=29031 RepID=UPI00248366C7|nr:relaxin receptor 1 [Phlebotomus papatasi]
MSFRRSIIVGGILIILLILLSTITFYLSLGPCPRGSFACDNGTVCVPQRAICDNHGDCKDEDDEDPVMCGMFYGSTSVLHNLMQSVRNKNGTVLETNNRTCERELERLAKAKRCGCIYSLMFFCKNLSLTTVPQIRSNKVTRLYLAYNKIKLTGQSFSGLNLEFLDLKFNNISNIPPDTFKGQTELMKLFLSNNDIVEITPGTFDGLNSLIWLLLRSNRLMKFPLIELSDLQSLELLDLSHNRLTLANDKFPKMNSTLELVLDGNLIEEIDDKLFAGLGRLHLLSLHSNRIRSIHPHAFKELTDLRELGLSNNLLHHLPDTVLASMSMLEALYLQNNNISITRPLLNFTNLLYLNLDGIPNENIKFDAVSSLITLKSIVFTKFYYCGNVPHVKNCKPNTDGISTLEDLLSKPVLRYSAWLMALVTCMGNGLVLWGRFALRDENRAVSMVIRNLAVADMLMGFYLVIISIQDFRYRNRYHEVAQDWASSWNCTLAGLLAMTSSEVSMLILAFMSVERFLLIADPFGGHRRLDSRNVLTSMIAIWTVGGTIAIIPVIHWRSSTRFYGTYSGTCFPLHVQERFPLGWQYSAFVFLGVNLSLLMLIASLYTALLVSIWRTRRATPLAVLDCEFAIRFFFIVLTDATCWAPIIALKILAFLSYEISADIYAWIVIFILPLNSAVNPLLYTFTTPRYRDKIGIKSWPIIFKCRRHEREAGVVGEGTANGLTNSNPDESQGKILPLLYTPNTATHNWKI